MLKNTAILFNKRPFTRVNQYFTSECIKLDLNLNNNNNNNNLIAFPLSGYSMLQMNNKLSLIN